jgi:hypothetical protein
MKREPKSINVPPELAAPCDRPDAAEGMDQLFRAVISISNSAIVNEEATWKRAQARKQRSAS